MLFRMKTTMISMVLKIRQLAGIVKRGDLDKLGDDAEDEDEDDERHLRMLQGITGMPSQAFEGITSTSRDQLGA